MIVNNQLISTLASQIKRNIMSNFKDRRNSIEKNLQEKEYIRSFMK